MYDFKSQNVYSDKLIDIVNEYNNISNRDLKPIQNGEQKDPLTSFSHVTSTSVEISLHKFLNFGFCSFATTL